jgi:hypothetical protein
VDHSAANVTQPRNILKKITQKIKRHTSSGGELHDVPTHTKCLILALHFVLVHLENTSKAELTCFLKIQFFSPRQTVPPKLPQQFKFHSNYYRYSVFLLLLFAFLDYTTIMHRNVFLQHDQINTLRLIHTERYLI